MVFRFLLHDFRYEYRRHQWREKAQHLGQGVGVAPPPLGGTLLAGKPPEQQRSIAKSWPPPSRDWSKVLGLEHSWAKNSGKSLPCQENVAHFSRLMARPVLAKALKKPPDGGGLFACLENQPVSRPCMQTPKVGTHYFFLSLLLLIRYLETVFPLRAGPLFSKIC
jgi:hypothetical protein